MKTLFLNDTRSAEHVGCELVMRNSLRECERIGLEMEALWTTAECQTSLLERLPTVDFEVLLINGEGSMHHDRPLPTCLCEAARWAQEQGKKVILFNSLWEGNEALNAYLPSFDRIYCRDSLSAEAVRAAGGKCETVPDMIFATDPKQWDAAAPSPHHNELTIIDSIDRKKSERLSKLAAYYGYPFLHMDRIGYERLKKKFFVRTGWFAQKGGLVDGFVKPLRSSRRVLSGRFHGTCLAMVLGVPVVSIRSNTRKQEALLKDVGLPEHLALSQVPKRVEAIESLMEEAESALPQVEAYVAQARVAIHAMFDEIAAELGSVAG